MNYLVFCKALVLSLINRLFPVDTEHWSIQQPNSTYLRTEFFSEFWLETGQKQKHKTDRKVSTISNCQIYVWASQPLGVALCGARKALGLDSVGQQDI